MTRLEQVIQVIAWALWFEQNVDNDHDCDDPYCGHLDEERWEAWLTLHAHEPPRLQDACDCGTHRQLCAEFYRPPAPRDPSQPTVSLTHFDEVMKHCWPERMIGELALRTKHPLFAGLVDGL